MSLSNFSVNSILQDKTIFVVGGSGFISKVWLSMILQFVPSVKKIFVLVRPNKQIDGIARFEKIYLTSPVFDNIRNIYGSNLFNLNKTEYDKLLLTRAPVVIYLDFNNDPTQVYLVKSLRGYSRIFDNTAYQNSLPFTFEELV